MFMTRRAGRGRGDRTYPGGKGQGFAPSAFGVRGRLYVSGNDGIFYRLNAAADGWEAIGKLNVP